MLFWSGFYLHCRSIPRGRRWNRSVEDHNYFALRDRQPPVDKNFVLDLSERKRGEEALLRSEAYLAQAQRLSQTGSFWWKVSSEELIWSDEAFRVMGYERTMRPSVELVFKRVHPEDIQLVQHMVSRAAREGMNMDFEHRLLMPDGSVKHVHVMLEAVCLDPENREFVGTVMDITARKQAEEAVSKAQAELAHVTRVTTLGELAASIAHEVNQPLTGIINNADACLGLLPNDTVEFDEVREALSEIVNDADRASAVLARIRGLVKKTRSEKARLHLRDLVSDVLLLARAEAAARRVIMQAQIPEDLPFAFGDRVQLQQVLLNLVMNGLDAMNNVEEQKRLLLISGRRDAYDGWPAATISVQDFGIGLKTEEIERLFDAFYTTKPQGMGMGLAISRSIIEDHGGRLWAEPNEGPGATFLFTLPAADRPYHD